MADNSSETVRLTQQAANGDQQSWAALLARHEGKLRRVVAFRMDQRLQGRIDASDVLQEAYLVAAQHLAEYLRQPAMSFYLWLRGIVGNKLLELHRHHLGTQMRDAGREVSLYQGALPEASSAALAARLLGHLTGPSEAAVRAEMKVRLQEGLNSLDPLDREVLALRHFEHLTPAETAAVLGIKEKAAGMRYLRALKRLKDILTGLPGGLLPGCEPPARLPACGEPAARQRGRQARKEGR
jgi:RNA polymerase sigma-70 factor (ECF subfamily)